EMNKRVVLQPQRKIAGALRFCSLQFRKHGRDQISVLVGQLRLGLIPDQGLFHHPLLSVFRDAKSSLSRPKTFGPRKRIRPPQNYFAPHPFAFPPRLAVKAPRDAAAKQAENGMQEPYGKSDRSEEHTSELQSRGHLVCRLLLEKK